MNQAHLHLLITHLPIFGSVLGVIVLVYGMWRKSNPTKGAACLLFIISSVGAGASYLTGEGAEEVVENIPGISESLIEQHEEFAVYALISLIILGIVSLLTLVITAKGKSFVRQAYIITLFIAQISFVLVARTGYIGGQIRHTEISTGNDQNTDSKAGGKQDND